MSKLFNAFENFEPIKITKPIRLIELFAGVGSQAMALRDIGAKFEHYRVCEFDKYTIQSYNAIHGTSFPVSDIRDWTGDDLGIVDKDKYEYIMTYSFPCFTGDTLVTTDSGIVPIKDIKIGDSVLTHDGTYKKVTDSRCTGNKPLWKIRTQMGYVSKCTGNHKIYVRKKYKKWNTDERTYIRSFSDPQYISVFDLSTSKKVSDYYVGFPINKNSIIPIWNGVDMQWNIDKRPNRCDHKNEIGQLVNKYDFWWIIGRYVADGWIRQQGGIIIAYPDSKESELLNHVNSLGINYTISRERTCNKLHIARKEYSMFVQPICKGAANKKIPQFILDLPVNLLEGFLMGYLSGDGSFDGTVHRATSTSKYLIYGFSQIVAKVFHRSSGIYYNKPRGTSIIDGRCVNNRESWSLHFKTHDSPQDKAFFENGFIWYPISKLEATSETDFVYDITVESNHSFVANNMIVHNCTDISTAGKQLGMSKDSGTRSGLLWEVERLLKETKELPQILLMENVTQVHSDKFIKDFNNWCNFLKSIGYTNKWADLEATDYGVAQTRNRCFMVSILGKINYDFPKPIPLNKVLIDYLEPYVDKRYYVTTDFAKKLVRDIVEQNRLVLKDCITPQIDSVRWVRTEEGKVLRKDYESGKIHHGFNEYRVIEQRPESVSGTITTVTKDNIVLEVDKVETDVVRMVGRNPDNPTSRKQSDVYEQRLEVKETVGCGTLTTATKDNICLEKYVIENMDFNERGTVHNEFGVCRTITGSGGDGGYHSGNQPKVLQLYKVVGENRYILAHPYSVYSRKFNLNECSGTLGTNCDHYNSSVSNTPIELLDESNCSIFGIEDIEDFVHTVNGKKYLILIRKLTPLECWRLMGFTDEDFNAAKESGVSNSQLYKQAGNSIVKQVLMAIFRNMNIQQ